MSLDEKDRCALETSKSHLLTLECLNSTVIGIDIRYCITEFYEFVVSNVLILIIYR